MPKKTVLRSIIFALIIIWSATTFQFSNQNGKDSSNLSREVASMLVSEEEQIAATEPLIRKIAHLSEYAVGGMLFLALFLTYSLSDAKRMFWSLLLGLGFAIADEIHQLFIDGRSGQIVDVGIDTIGVAIRNLCFLIALQKRSENLGKEKGRRFRIDKNKRTIGFLGILFLGWFLLIFLFSSQSARESSKVSDKVTRELLKIKDTLVVVMENYKDTHEIVLKRSRNSANYKSKSG